MPPKPRRQRQGQGQKRGTSSRATNTGRRPTNTGRQTNEREAASSQRRANVVNYVQAPREPERTTISKEQLQEYSNIFLTSDDPRQRQYVYELMNEFLKDESISDHCKKIYAYIKEQCSIPSRVESVRRGGDKVVKILPRKLAKIKNKTKEIRKIYLGKRGGKYYIRNNRKIYVKD
jgi:hypothetical protein